MFSSALSASALRHSPASRPGRSSARRTCPPRGQAHGASLVGCSRSELHGTLAARPLVGFSRDLMEEDLAGEEMTGAGHGRQRGWGEAKGEGEGGAGRGAGAPNTNSHASYAIGKNKFVIRDLKSFFPSISVGSGSGLSTYESQIGVDVDEEFEEIHQDPVVVSEVESTDVRTKQAQT